jgi:hypothetical protein
VTGWPSGLIGRTVMAKITRGEVTAAEPCEVVACQTGGQCGTWKVMIATHDGTLLSVGYDTIKLVALDDHAGPYR